MLILRRKTGESLIVNENIKITVLESGSDGVRLEDKIYGKIYL